MGRDIIRSVVRNLLKRIPLPINGLFLYLDPYSLALLPKILSGKYERFQTTLLKEVIKKDWTVVDIGGHIGYYTLLFSILARRVYSFEPTESTFYILRKNVKLLHKSKNITLTKAAVSNRTGYRKFYISEIFGADNTFGRRNFETRKVVKVRSISLDSFFARKTQKIDFVKIDVQGYEPFVFDGMKKILKQNKDLIIMTEFWSKGIKNVGREPRAFLRLIKYHKFNIFIIDEINQQLRGPVDVNYVLEKNEEITDLLLARNKVVFGK